MASSVIKYRAKGPTKIQKITKRAIPDYLSFIHGEGSYTLGFDFSFLRGLNRSEALKSVDVGVFRVLESIWLCTLDVPLNVVRLLETLGVFLAKALQSCCGSTRFCISDCLRRFWWSSSCTTMSSNYASRK
jgi:hypothetical protein